MYHTDPDSDPPGTLRHTPRTVISGSGTPKSLLSQSLGRSRLNEKPRFRGGGPRNHCSHRVWGALDLMEEPGFRGWGPRNPRSHRDRIDPPLLDITRLRVPRGPRYVTEKVHFHALFGRKSDRKATGADPMYVQRQSRPPRPVRRGNVCSRYVTRTYNFWAGPFSGYHVYPERTHSGAFLTYS